MDTRCCLLSERAAPDPTAPRRCRSTSNGTCVPAVAQPKFREFPEFRANGGRVADVEMPARPWMQECREPTIGVRLLLGLGRGGTEPIGDRSARKGIFQASQCAASHSPSKRNVATPWPVGETAAFGCRLRLVAFAPGRSWSAPTLRGDDHANRDEASPVEGS
jgi:hypothetical protein